MKTKILTVDDNILNLRLIQNILKSDDRIILTGEDGYEAIKILNNNPDISLIIMDIQMPGLSGFETVKIIKEIPELNRIPVIFITGMYITDEFLNIGFDIGAHDYILKPFDNFLLQNKVNIFIKLYHQQRELEQKAEILETINRQFYIINQCEGILTNDTYNSEEDMFNKFRAIIKNYAKHDDIIFIPYYLIDSQEKIYKNNAENLSYFNLLKKEKIPEKLYPEIVALINIIFDGNDSISGSFKEIDMEERININKYYYLLNKIIIGDNIWGISLIVSIDPYLLNSEELYLLNEVHNYFKIGIQNNKTKLLKIKAEKALALEKEELAIYLKSISDGVITVNSKGIIKFTNKAADEILGYEAGELINKPINNIVNMFNNKNEKIIFNPYDLLKTQNENIKTKKQYIIEDNDGNRKIILGNASDLRDSQNNFKGLAIVFEDITEKVRVENQISLSQKMESVGQLASGIAHEINSPMQFIGDNTYFLKDAFNSISNYLLECKNIIIEDNLNLEDSIKEKFSLLYQEFDIEYLTAEIPVAIERNEEGIKRVSKLVLAMKNFAHPDLKERSLADINSSIDDTITISRNVWKNVATLETEYEEFLPKVNCSICQINQVLLNLIVNSTHAIEEKFIKSNELQGLITIKTKKSDGFIEILFSDNGNGIRKDIQNRIFDPFFTTKEVGKGTGQGLAIAHDIIVNKHKGKIDFDSEPGEGTTFTIQLPINGE